MHIINLQINRERVGHTANTHTNDMQTWTAWCVMGQNVSHLHPKNRPKSVAHNVIENTVNSNALFMSTHMVLSCNFLRKAWVDRTTFIWNSYIFFQKAHSLGLKVSKTVPALQGCTQSLGWVSLKAPNLNRTLFHHSKNYSKITKTKKQSKSVSGSALSWSSYPQGL